MLFATGCGRYADFTLPTAAGGDPSVDVPLPAASPAGAHARSTRRRAESLRVAGGVNLYSGLRRAVAHRARHHATTASTGRSRASSCATAWEAATSRPTERAARTTASSGIGTWPAPRTACASRWRARRTRRAWRKERSPVLETGPVRSWDERGVADPYVIRIGAYFYMYYLGPGSRRRQRSAWRARADGIHWEKLRANPVLEIGDDGTSTSTASASPRSGSRTASTGCSTPAATSTRTATCGLARSTDGVHWTKLAARSIAGDAAWNSKVICDPTVVVGRRSACTSGSAAATWRRPMRTCTARSALLRWYRK